MKFEKPQRQNEQIDISPMIDMVFILLIFFMVTTTFVKDMKLELNRPGASSATMASAKSIRIYIDKDSEIYMNDQPIRLWLIQSRLRDALKAASEKSVLVVVDDGVPSQRLISVVDQCRLAGAKDVGVATQREEES